MYLSPTIACNLPQVRVATCMITIAKCGLIRMGRDKSGTGTGIFRVKAGQGQGFLDGWGPGFGPADYASIILSINR